MNQCIQDLMEQVQNCQKGLFNIEYVCPLNSREENPVSVKKNVERTDKPSWNQFFQFQKVLVFLLDFFFK